jgi:hypothetical protein
MPDASQTLARPAPLSVYLLAEHLDAALAAGEDLARVHYIWSGPPPRSSAAIEAIRAGQRGAVERIKLFELALIARLLKAREWAAALAFDDDRFAGVARLYVAGTAILLDAVAECGDTSAVDFDTGDDLTAYVRSRALIAVDAPALADAAPIGAGDGFMVARRVPLGVLLDLVATFLDALEAEFDLFVEPAQRKSAGEHAASPPADAPLQ